MKRLIPAPLPATPDFDPVASFPADVERLVAAAENAGYTLSSIDAGELWRRHSDDLCASWLGVTGYEHSLMAALLKHAEVIPEVENHPAPPQGYASWLDFAVDTMDTRSEELVRSFADETVSRQAMRDAVQAELLAVRRKASKF